MINFCVIVYMDDILVYPESYHGHTQHIEWTLGALRDAGFKIALEKSEFFLPEISFLGYVVTRGGLRPDSRKVEAIRDAPTPTSLTQVRAFLRLASYYRRFIKGFAATARPLTNLLRKDQPLRWEAECERAFVTLKEALATTPILIRPDPTKQFILMTDWQPEAISAILAQKGNDGREHVIEYASRTVPDERGNDSAPQGECYAVVWGIQHFHPYLYGQKFLLVKDHEPLLALKRLTNYTGMIGRWAVRLQEYDFDIIHWKTERHKNADGLTRLHHPTKVAKVPLIKPLQWEIWCEEYSTLSLCLVGIALTCTQDSEHRAASESVEVLIIQAWRKDVEGDLFGFIFRTVDPGHRQTIVWELLVPFPQLLEDLPTDIVSHCDENPAPHVLSRNLTPYLQWSACLEDRGGGGSCPSRAEYLNPRGIINVLFFQPRTASKEEAVEEEAAKEDKEEETSEEEGSYSEYSEKELGALSKEEEEEEEEEGEESEWESLEGEADQAEVQGEDPATREGGKK
ncbi:hypothetical protein CBR_g3532 [Chara braunii]|uniref:Reverse transcriptase domain-containing protein n=1 Tax=Chara braunii TaxID=69332 RepID=A0A388KFL2_CHABU|nr:hypothetical protein CBR_g3532 [Chara braunii]|eukprot:GBG68838.1 hypothetical protein CBR_g3532 [Chara braunii]